LRLNRFTQASLSKTGESFAAERINTMAMGNKTIEANHIPMKGETTCDAAKLSPTLINTK
jgi:hypothetical protein